MDHALILDRYRPLAELGSGGFASVTLAYDTKMGRRVAIKRMPLPLDPAGRVRRVGLAEARTAAMLAHPAIVTVFEWDTDPDEAFIIMEHVEGASLAEVLGRLGRLDLDETAAVVEAVADALSFAHDNGVLHLDVKPENVLVTRTGSIKVADFGISTLTGLGGTAIAAEGTLGFMPPEQLRSEPLDRRADEWALASLAFELLTGANPFASATPADALARAESRVPRASELLRGVPAEVDEVLAAALSPEPAERYASVAAFADALLPWLGDPDAGMRSLAATANELSSDETAEEEAAYEPLGLWDRLAPRAPLVTRVCAALVCGWLAYLGLLPIGVGTLARLAGALLVAVAGAAAPALGVGLALLAFAAGALVARAPVPAAFAVLAALSWLVLGRGRRGDMLLAAASPAFAVVRAAPAVPLLLGYTFAPLPAAVAAGVAALWTALLAAAGGHLAPLVTVEPRLLLDPWPAFAIADFGRALLAPGPYAAALSWAAAAAVVSVFARRGTRSGAALGVALGMIALLAGYGMWALLLGRGFAPATSVLQQLAASLILMAFVVALGPPVRGEGDDQTDDDREAG